MYIEQLLLTFWKSYTEKTIDTLTPSLYVHRPGQDGSGLKQVEFELFNSKTFRYLYFLLIEQHEGKEVFIKTSYNNVW